MKAPGCGSCGVGPGALLFVVAHEGRTERSTTASAKRRQAVEFVFSKQFFRAPLRFHSESGRRRVELTSNSRASTRPRTLDCHLFLQSVSLSSLCALGQVSVQTQ